MGGQNIKRREALRVIGLASVAAGFPGFRRWAFACEHHVSGASTNVAVNAPYRPLFFSEQQYRLVARIAEMTIPPDGSPGASEAGVPEFIDFMVANCVPVSSRRESRSTEGTREIRSTQDAVKEGHRAQERFVAGLNWIDARASSEFARKFLDCTPEQQNALLEELAYKKKFTPSTEDGREFFAFIRDYTVIGYYTSRVGLEALGYPGLRTVWPSMPGCTHPDDPEHVRLREPEFTGGAFQKATKDE